MQNNRQTGAAYEEQAARYLEEQGCRVLEKNYRCRQGEIDLIVKDGRYLVFVEVKYRKTKKAGHPAEAVNFHKQQRISKAALYYCYGHRIPQDQPCRFDVVSILDGKIEHIKDAFEMQG